jgi:hypothetical protein
MFHVKHHQVSQVNVSRIWVETLVMHVFAI